MQAHSIDDCNLKQLTVENPVKNVFSKDEDLGQQCESISMIIPSPFDQQVSQEKDSSTILRGSKMRDH